MGDGRSAPQRAVGRRAQTLPEPAHSFNALLPHLSTPNPGPASPGWGLSASLFSTSPPPPPRSTYRAGGAGEHSQPQVLLILSRTGEPARAELVRPEATRAVPGPRGLALGPKPPSLSPDPCCPGPTGRPHVPSGFKGSGESGSRYESSSSSCS